MTRLKWSMSSSTSAAQPVAGVRCGQRLLHVAAVAQAGQRIGQRGAQGQVALLAQGALVGAQLGDVGEDAQHPAVGQRGLGDVHPAVAVHVGLERAERLLAAARGRRRDPGLEVRGGDAVAALVAVVGAQDLLPGRPGVLLQAQQLAVEAVGVDQPVGFVEHADALLRRTRQFEQSVGRQGRGLAGAGGGHGTGRGHVEEGAGCVLPRGRGRRSARCGRPLVAKAAEPPPHWAAARPAGASLHPTREERERP